MANAFPCHWWYVLCADSQIIAFIVTSVAVTPAGSLVLLFQWVGCPVDFRHRGWTQCLKSFCRDHAGVMSLEDALYFVVMALWLYLTVLALEAKARNGEGGLYD